MTQLTDKQLLEYSRQALIPGLHEAEEEFIQRVNYCFELKDKLRLLLEKEFAFAPSDDQSQEALEEAYPTSESLFAIRADWLPLYFSNQHLAPWHGGCAWIFQMDEASPIAALMQLRSHFRTSGRYLGIYRRDELIAHELAHVGRMKFEEPVFEELLAYRTSPSAFRRWFGPMVASSKETLLFVIVIGTIFALDLLTILSNQPALYHQLLWVKLLPFLLIFAGLARLWWRQRLFSACLGKLERLLSDRKKANELIYRLSDEQISDFARRSPKAIRDYIEENKDKSLHFRLLRLIMPL